MVEKEQRIVLASNNRGKLREFNQLLEPSGLSVIPQGDFGPIDVDETGLSFVENAILKARAASEHSGLPALADDSGIEVDALNGAPGIYSARYAGEGASDLDNLNKLLQALHGMPEEQRGARFRCVIVSMRHPADPTPLICVGTWEGRILPAPLGENGFGYDPVFYVPTHQCSSAQLPAEEKNRISHRGQALAALLQALKRG